MGFVPFFSAPSARMGIMWTLSAVEKILAIEFGPAGTTNYLNLTLPKMNARGHFRLFTTHISEKDIILGDTERLKKAVLELERRYAPEYIFVLQSAVAAVIGVDLQRVVEELQPMTKARLIFVSCRMRSDWTTGVEKTLLQLAKELPAECGREQGCFNVIGSCMDEFNYLSDVNEVIRMMKDYFHFRVNGVMVNPSTLESLKKLGRAQFNLVLRKEGIPAAEHLKERFGTPYLYFRPYGALQTERVITKLEEMSGRKRDRDNFLADMETYQWAVEQLELLMERIRPKHTVVTGSRNLTEPLCEFLRAELRLKDVRGYCNSKRWACEELPYQEGLCRIEEAGTLALTDGISKSKLRLPAVQVSNPNYNRKILFPHTPYVGIRGGTYLIESIYQELEEYNKSGKAF